jgi:hypothetical protein
MRIRGTKPDFWRSERIASVEWDARLVLKGLESFVDDNGVGKDDIALIVGDLFQRDLVREPSRTLARVSEAISELHDAGLVWRYEADGTRLLFISFWEQAQRVDKPQPGRFPRPDGTMNYKDSAIRGFLAKPRESSRSLAPVLGEQGNRGTGEKDPPYPPNDETPPLQPIATGTKNGSEIARSQFANLPARSLDAYRIAEAFSASLPVPIEATMLAAVGKQIDKCLKSDIPPPAVAEGLKAWTASDSWSPTQIPNFVHKANNRASPTTGKPTRKAMGYEQALTELLQEVETL